MTLWQHCAGRHWLQTAAGPLAWPSIVAMPQPRLPTSALHRLPYSSLALVLSTVLLVWASQPDRVRPCLLLITCCRVLLAEPHDAEEWLQDAKDLVHNSYVLQESGFLPLPGQRDGWHGRYNYVIACSYPTSQQDPGESSKQLCDLCCP